MLDLRLLKLVGMIYKITVDVPSMISTLGRMLNEMWNRSVVVLTFEVYVSMIFIVCNLILLFMTSVLPSYRETNTSTNNMAEPKDDIEIITAPANENFEV